MDKQPTKRRGPITLFSESRRFRLATAIGALLVLVGYPLSTGPAAWIWVHAPVSLLPGYTENMTKFYSPLEWLYERSESIRGVSEAYQRLWISGVSDDELMQRVWLMEGERWEKDHPISP